MRENATIRDVLRYNFIFYSLHLTNLQKELKKCIAEIYVVQFVNLDH